MPCTSPKASCRSIGRGPGSWRRRRSLYRGLWTIKRRRAEDPRAMTLVAMVGAAIFVISCMPVPIPWIGTCSHPCGTGPGALLIGPGPTVVVASIALLLQALLLTHGGLTTLGANIVSMGVVGAFGAYGVFRRIAPVPSAAVRRGLPGRHVLRLGHLRHDFVGAVDRFARRRLTVGRCLSPSWLPSCRRSCP